MKTYFEPTLSILINLSLVLRGLLQQIKLLQASQPAPLCLVDKTNPSKYTLACASRQSPWKPSYIFPSVSMTWSHLFQHSPGYHSWNVCHTFPQQRQSTKWGWGEIPMNTDSPASFKVSLSTKAAISPYRSLWGFSSFWSRIKAKSRQKDQPHGKSCRYQAKNSTIQMKAQIPSLTWFPPPPPIFQLQIIRLFQILLLFSILCALRDLQFLLNTFSWGYGSCCLC